jgi:hypothetical protein
MAISILRQYQTTGAIASLELSTGYISNAGDTVYLPITLDNFSAPDITVTGVAGASAATVLTAAEAGAFDGLRVGDIVTSSSVGSFTAPAPVSRTCYTVQGQNYLVYAHTFTPSTLNVRAGDAVSGTGIAAGAKVDKIDYSTRRIFLTLANTASDEVSVTFQGSVRVTAVRKSTATVNPNQVDVSSAVDTALVASSVVFTPGIAEAPLAIFQIAPTGSTNNGTAKLSVGASRPDPLTLEYSADGVFGGDVTTLNYVNLGIFSIDLDSYLTDARVPRPTV